MTARVLRTVVQGNIGTRGKNFMAVIGQARLPTAAPRTPAPAAPQAPQQAQAPQAPQTGGSKGWANAKSRSNGGLFLHAIDRNNAASYLVKINRVIQKWANPRFVNPEFAQPTPEEAATAEPAFKKKDSYIIECEVMESNNPLCPVGYTPSIVFNDIYPDSYMGDIKGFLAAVCNADPSLVTIDDWAGSYKPDQPLAGSLVRVVVREQKNKSNDGYFTRHIFNPAVVA